MAISFKITLIAVLFGNMALVPLYARNSILDITTATQQTISDNKQVIAAIGAVTLVGLGAYWWHSARSVSKSNNSLIDVIAPQPLANNEKKPTLLIKLPSSSQKFLHDGQNQPISVGACIPTELIKPEKKHHLSLNSFLFYHYKV